MKIHREGHQSIIIIVISIFLIGFALQWVSSVSSYLFLGLGLLLVIFLLYFFRNPERGVKIKDNYSVFAPADGKVVVIENTFEDEYLKSSCIQLSIFMSPLNVHVNRYPVSGKIDYKKYHKGKYLVAWHPKSSTENERTSIGIVNNTGKIFLRQIAGIMARRIICYAHKDRKVEQGEELGFIKFGSRVDLFLPLDAEIKVSLNQHVKAGIDVLAELKSTDKT